MKGIDWGFGKIKASTIKNAGYSFVCRYLSRNYAKDISKDEIADLRSEGLEIVLVWETTEQRALDGYDAGVEDAQEVKMLLNMLGLPSNSVVYFAADYDFTEDQQSAIQDYLSGVQTLVNESRLGIYGSYLTVKSCFDAKMVCYGWQTYAWSRGKWDPRAQLRQTYIYGPQLDGVDCDTNEAIAEDFGQIKF